MINKNQAESNTIQWYIVHRFLSFFFSTPSAFLCFTFFWFQICLQREPPCWIESRGSGKVKRGETTGRGKKIKMIRFFDNNIQNYAIYTQYTEEGNVYRIVTSFGKETYRKIWKKKRMKRELVSFHHFFKLILNEHFFLLLRLLLVRTENRTPLDVIAFCFCWFGSNIVES